MSDVRGSAIGLLGADGIPLRRVRRSQRRSEDWAGPDNLFGYTGLGYDFNSGHSYARARYFDSEVGRFISEDTYRGELNNPQTLNLYTYAGNNPLIHIDLSGNTYTWILNSISKGYNNGMYNSSDASLMIFGGSSLSFLLPDMSVTTNVGEPNFKDLFVPFHEIAQINVAKALYKKYGKHPTLEKKLETGKTTLFGLKKTHYEADIVLEDKVWEVKPKNGKDPKNQLELYKKIGGLVEGAKLPTITDITVFDNIKMRIEFPNKGEAIYSLYVKNGNGTIKNLSTVGAAIMVAKALVKVFPAGRKLSPGF